ncbi:MAG: 2-oxoglutarate dehydrogenase E1 component [Myxococcales bacterium]|nr:2-oxoglutarate dehydrogenase E1 component [Myxococcales bacterium]
MYQRWREAPESVDPDWQLFFQGFELGFQRSADEDAAAAGQKAAPAPSPRPDLAAVQDARAQSNVASLIYAYRSLGHLAADLDPLGDEPRIDPHHPALGFESFGFTNADLDRLFDTGHLKAPDQLTLREIMEVLRQTYCRSVGVEYIHVQSREVRRWLQERMEPVRNRPVLSRARKRWILSELIDAEMFETFVHSRYPGQKRFSLEGGETLIPAMQSVIDLSAELGVEEIVIGMAHRGRLNVLSNIVGMSYEQIFSEFEGNFLADSVQGDGDVKYHKGYSSTVERHGRTVHLSLTANPSHLEAVYPVVEGRVRAKQRQRGDTDHRAVVLPLVLHGDAAFAGQGVVSETLQLSKLPGYHVGGTVHIIVNNQIGFTTTPDEARSTTYSTDVAKMVEAPIFHVNGDDPEAVVHCVELALRFRQKFHRDVVVDIVCYRRHGHNEGDDPAFTQPVLYRKIRNRPSVRALYTERLLTERIITEEEAERIAARFRDELDDAHSAAKRENPTLEVQAFEKHWSGLDAKFSFDEVDTSVTREQLARVTEALTTVPQGFNLNRKVARLIEGRRDIVQSGGDIDWGFAELLSFGTLLTEGTPVRLSGQDSARGTFSQRHAAWRDMESGERYLPLNAISDGQSRFCVYNSSLSEAAVLGFEYGYSVSEPNMVIIWEAQFGDFANGAQVIIDQFIAGSESKWQRDSGIVMLLPHGYEGQGPEHSNAYLERYLMACAEENIQVCYPSTPAQHFHMLRRQIKRNFRMPLVVMAPKSLLRNKLCVSPLSQLTEGTFQEILDDPQAPSKARRVVLCSGKIYYDLEAARQMRGAEHVALVRVEQLYPLRVDRLKEVIDSYGAARELLWVQEEPKNRGAWSFMFPHLLQMYPDRIVTYVGRSASASASTGSLRVHREEQAEIVESVLGSEVKRPQTPTLELKAVAGRER